MNTHQKSLRFGITVILCSLIFRMYLAGIFTQFARILTTPEAAAFLIYLETGRDVRSSLSHEVFLSFPAESPPPYEPHPPPYEPHPPPYEPHPPPEEASPPEIMPPFSDADADSISIYNLSGRRVDIAALLCQQANPPPEADGPEVLILHTHTTECYTPSADSFVQSSPYRTLDENYNMLSIGARVATILEEGGIAAIQDREVHDYPSYNGSYNHARKSLESYLEEYPSLRLVLDLHRDAADNGSGGQLRTLAAVDGEKSAQLMLVMGTDASGLEHPNWQDNLSAALKLHAILERKYPGITRHLILRKQRFNQDLCPGMLLVEVGAAGNTHEEAMLAAEALAKALLIFLQ